MAWRLQTIPLRTLVGAIGLGVAIVTATALPSGYLIVSYLNMSETLAFKARLNANRLSQYIYTHDALWQYQQVRLVDQIQLPRSREEPVQQRIYSSDDRLVLEEGPSLAAPAVTRREMIVVAGATLGYIDVAASFREVLSRTGQIAVLSALLGLGIYFALRMFPLRVLDRTLGALYDAQRNLSTQNGRLDAALTNMSQGLCMFDANEKLVIFNLRFAQLYGLPPDRIVPGMTTRHLMELAQSKSMVADADPAGTLALQASIFRERRDGSFIGRLSDGRSIAISYRPMPDGGVVATFEDITQRLVTEEKIRHMAHHDALTSLVNRVTFYERMADILTHMGRRESIAVLSLDLDHFKGVNDTLGHPIGDLLLQAAAKRMQSCVRGEDVVARLGGDEFAILQVPSERPPDVTALAARLIEVVGAPYDLDGQQVIVGVSVGIALAPTDGKQPDALMKNADLALYRAKADGGSVYRFFEVAMDARMQARRALELDLRKAIVNGEFELSYQPIISVKTGQITSCEALIRWHHPERGLISPMEFIPVAEEMGLIVPLGEWALRQACAEATMWPDHVTIAINVSPAQFKSRNLVPAVVGALAASGLSSARLELEITELVFMQDNEGAIATLHKFHDLGIRVAMDDFGTGYSSLGYLRSFPFDRIKIDQSFIQDLPEKGDSLAIVRAVVGLSRSLGITTTAEGVETKEQLASLTAEGCNEVQGFLFSHPRPAAEIARMIAEHSPRIEAVA